VPADHAQRPTRRVCGDLHEVVDLGAGADGGLNRTWRGPHKVVWRRSRPGAADDDVADGGSFTQAPLSVEGLSRSVRPPITTPACRVHRRRSRTGRNGDARCSVVRLPPLGVLAERNVAHQSEPSPTVAAGPY